MNVYEGRKPQGVVAKHKLLHDFGDWDATIKQAQVFHEFLGSIRNRSLQKLCYIRFILMYTHDNGLCARIKERVRKQGYSPDRENVAQEITLQEIMNLIGCSERTAIEYKKALQIMSTW